MRRLTFAVILAVVIISLYFQGCGAMIGPAVVVGGAQTAVGKEYLPKDRESILVTEDNNVVAHCDFIKDVLESSSWGGFFLQDESMERVIADMTTDAVDAGANVLLIKKMEKGFWGSAASGAAYRCPNIDNSATTSVPK